MIDDDPSDYTQKKMERGGIAWGRFFVCVLPFTKFLKKIDEEMKMKMRERERSRWWLFFQAVFCCRAQGDKKKKNLSLPQSSLPKSKVDNNNPPKSLFCAW